ncbi:hypothetical protein HMPREF1508_1793 [Shuttleworthella sp. MSX8B]|nr:hypothetical protein HMPREF1508_1793 [Shuttleworthia sp. MSX8B]
MGIGVKSQKSELARGGLRGQIAGSVGQQDLRTAGKLGL